MYPLDYFDFLVQGYEKIKINVYHQILPMLQSIESIVEFFHMFSIQRTSNTMLFLSAFFSRRNA